MQQDKQLIEKYSVIIAEFMGDFNHTSDNNFETFIQNINKYKFEDFTYHTDWNEIHKVWYRLWSSELGTIEKIEYFTKKRKFIEKALVLLPEPYEVFVLIGETIEYLNKIK